MKATPCYMCHGKKIIGLAVNGERKGLGCPACKTRKSDVIGEGFVYRDQAQDPAIAKLAHDAVMADLAAEVAEAFGISYRGRQERSRGEALFCFHDDEPVNGTETTFFVEHPSLVGAHLVCIRDKFGKPLKKEAANA